METQIINILKKVIKENYNIEISDVTLENPPKKELGDFAFGCFVLSKELKKSPAMIASDLELLLVEESIIDDANAT